jgi:hypothetical protein
VSRPGVFIETVGVAPAGADVFTARLADPVGRKPVDMAQGGAYTALAAQLFGTDDRRQLVAFASACRQERVLPTIMRLSEEIKRTSDKRCLITSAAEIVGLCADRARVACAPALSGPLDRADRLAEIKAGYDVILVDAGSLAQTGEILGIARKMHGIVIIAESGETRRNELTHAVSTISAAGGQIVGVVLYRGKRRLPRWLERLVG